MVYDRAVDVKSQSESDPFHYVTRDRRKLKDLG